MPTDPRTAPRRAVVCMNSWAGRTESAVEVIGETPKRYRVRFLGEGFVGGNRRHAPGDIDLVPKDAVRFEEQP